MVDEIARADVILMGTPMYNYGMPGPLKAGDYVILRAEIDCVVVLSCCPQDMVDIHGQSAKPVDVQYAVSA